MLKTLNSCLLITFLSFVFQASGQNNTSSPYSAYGIGDIALNTYGQHKAMGGTAFALRSPYHINISNPASFSAFSHAFIYEFGAKAKMVDFSTINENHLEYDFNIQYVAMGFPLGEYLGASMGLTPFSDIGYNVRVAEYTAETGNYQYNYFGTGGINRLYFGLSGCILKKFSIGANINYLYGDMRRVNTIFFTDSGSEVDNYQQQTNSVVSDFWINSGFQYLDTLKNDIAISFGAVFDNKTKINVTSSGLSATMNGANLTELDPRYVQDTISYFEGVESYFDLPTNFGAGFGIEKKDKFIVAVDYYQQNWEKATFLGKTDSLTNSSRFSFGAEYIPNVNASSSEYWKKINYRIGGHYNKTYLRIFDNQINDLGLSFGFGFPVRQKSVGRSNTRSTLNVSCEIGQRGTVNDNLIKENYYIITLNLNLYDNSWFIKRKFD